MRAGKVIFLGLGAVVLAAAAVIGGAYWSFGHRIDGEKAAVLDAAHAPGKIVTDEMLAGLPEPAQRYLRYAGVIGKPIPRTVVVHQTGRIRSAPTAKWMELEADEYYATTPPRFLWRAYVPKRSMPIVLGRDTYRDGKASILIKMLALRTVADAHGEELGDAGLLRYLGEVIWFPAAFLNDNITFKAVDAGSFDVTISDSGHTVTARIFVDSQGRMINLVAHRLNTDTNKIERWENPVTGYGVFEGLRVPSRGSAVWARPSGGFEYIQLEVTGITYDPA